MEQIGYLTHRAGGPGGANWIIDYDPESREDGETGHRLDTHRLRIGEYVSLRDSKSLTPTFIVADVRPVLTTDRRAEISASD
jgi:hypothetical protein